MAIPTKEDYDGETSPQSSTRQLKTRNGLTLVPQPTDDPRDPLNWSQAKKYLYFSIMCFAAFIGTSSATSQALSSTAQSKTFGVSTQVVSYTIAGTIAGLLIGPMVMVPCSQVIGITSVSFWSLILTIAFSIWSAEASDPDDLISFAVSRGLVGFFCQVPQVLTGGVIINIFFLHERGKTFAIFSTLYVLGTAIGPSLDGIIVKHSTWPDAFWWLVAGNGFAAAMMFIFMEDTNFDRSNGKPAPVHDSSARPSWVSSRVQTFFPGNKVVPGANAGQIHKLVTRSFAITLCPATILAGLYTLVNFSWYVANTIELSIFLQEPYKPDEGAMGYGFDPQQTGLFYISLWLGILAAQAWGIGLNDRLPLYLYRRRRGKMSAAPSAAEDGNAAAANRWHPEYRLHTAWVPGLVVLPAGLGIFGAALQYHLHYMVLALASFLIAIGGPTSVPVSLNYVAESFRRYPQEVGAAMNTYRLVFALFIPFFFDGWVRRVGVGWAFGMQAFFSIAVFAFGLGPLMLFGERIRSWSFVDGGEAEDGIDGDGPGPMAVGGH